MRGLVQRLWIVAPWIINIWILSQAMSGKMNGFLAFFLLIILIPVAALLNIVTAVYFKGKDLFASVQPQNQTRSNQRVEAVNYADLPWWNHRKWTNR